MAGGHKSGVEPKFVESIFDALYGEGVISGGSLCGAGGVHLMRRYAFETKPHQWT